MKHQYISISRIKHKDDRFRISFDSCSPELKESISKYGLIQPLLAVKRERDILLVSGWKRIQACLELKIESVPCLFFENENDLEMYSIALNETLTGKSLSLIEKALCLQKLKNFFKVEESSLLSNYCSILNIPPNPDFLLTYLKAAKLDNKWKNLISEKSIPFQAVGLLVNFNSKTLDGIYPVVSVLNQNKQKQLLEDLYEISQKHTLPAEQILSQIKASDLIKNEKLSSIQKSDKICLLMRKRRYPVFYSWKDQFESSIRQFKLPKNMIIESSPFFEENYLFFRFQFKTCEEFRTNIMTVGNIFEKPEFLNLLKQFGNEQ